jgi:hypothetical protein
MSPEHPHDPATGPGADPATDPATGPARAPDAQTLKYPFAVDGRWQVRHHVPYDIRHDGVTDNLVASLFDDPAPNADVTVAHAGEIVARYEGLTPGATLEITGDTWRVTEVVYREYVALERVGSVA